MLNSCSWIHVSLMNRVLISTDTARQTEPAAIFVDSGVLGGVFGFSGGIS